MEFIEGSRGTYRPIRVLSDRALQICWHVGSYEAQIPLVAGVSRLQQKNQPPSGVTAGDMTELLVEESKSTLRVQLWEFELEAFDEADARPFLKLVFEMNTGMKVRDVEFEARRLLKSPEAISPQFQHPNIISQAHEYARSPTEQQQESPSSKLLGPREVVMEVVPKVLQGFWLPLPNTSFNMPSKQLSKMAAGVTKAVEVRVSTVLRATLGRVAFSRSVRDDMVLSIQEKVRRGYAQDGLVKRLDCFAPEMPDAITDVAAGEICVLLQHRTRTKVSVNVNADKDCIQPADVVDGAEAQNSAEDVNEEPGPEEDTEAIRGPGSAVVTPPCGDVPVRNGSNHSRTEQPAPSPEPDSAGVSSPPLPLSLRDEPTVVTAVQGVLTSSADPAAAAAIHDGLNNSLDEAEEQPALGPQPDSAVVSSPPPPVIPVDEPPVSSAAPDEAIITEQPVKLDESLNATTEVKMAEMRGVGCFFGWLQKYVYCCVLPEDDTEAA